MNIFSWFSRHVYHSFNLFMVAFAEPMEAHIKVLTVVGYEKLQQDL